MSFAFGLALVHRQEPALHLRLRWIVRTWKGTQMTLLFYRLATRALLPGMEVHFIASSSSVQIKAPHEDTHTLTNIVSQNLTSRVHTFSAIPILLDAVAVVIVDLGGYVLFFLQLS